MRRRDRPVQIIRISAKEIPHANAENNSAFFVFACKTRGDFKSGRRLFCEMAAKTAPPRAAFRRRKTARAKKRQARNGGQTRLQNKHSPRAQTPRHSPRPEKKTKTTPPKMAGLRAARSPRCSRAESPALAGVSSEAKKTELPHWAIPLFSFIQTKTIGGNWHSPLYFRQAEMSNSPRTTLQGTPFDLQIFSKFSPNFSECVASSFPFG